MLRVSNASDRTRAWLRSSEPGPLLMIDFNLTGLSRGGQQVQKARDTYIKAVGTLVELASLQVSRL
jgi:hypothetical protein